jgi:hypothetical protein
MHFQKLRLPRAARVAGLCSLNDASQLQSKH